MRWMILAALLALLPGVAAAQPSAPQPSTPQAPPPRDVTITNETDRTVQELYLFPPGAAEGEDRLGNAVLAPSASLRVRLGRTRQCSFDMRATMEDGEEIRRRIDVCRNPRAAVNETGPRRELEVVNNADLDLRELYLTAPGARDRGRDRLGAGTIPPESSTTLRLRGTADCVFDLRAVFADDRQERRDRVDICRTPRLSFGDTSIPLREQPVANRGDRSIRELYARPATRIAPGTARGADWGPDRLGANILAGGGEFQLRLRSRDCAFDLRAVFEDNAEEVLANQDLCTGTGTGIAFAARPTVSRPLMLVNGFSRTIQQVFLSDTGATDWGEDALGSEVLPPGERTEVRMEGNCRADLRIVFDTSAAEERRDIDICAIGTLTLRPGWTIAEPLALPNRSGPALPPGPGAAAVPPGSIRLRNAAAVPVVELYADPPGAPRGADRLGRNVLGAGETLEFAPPDGLPDGSAGPCPTDLAAVFRDGREIRLPGTDLCAGGEVVLQ